MRDRSTYKVEIIEGLVNEPASDRRQLGPTEVVVALARPDEAAEPEQRSMLMALLSDEERQRLMRFHFERDRLLFLAAHALLRITLSRHASIQPYAWRFHTSSHGRPEIAEPGSRLRFSLAHTHGLAACAIVLDRDIGLDVEYLASGPPLDVVERFFLPREQFEILNASSDVRARRFLERWTLKEAYVKARGLGLSLPPDRFSMYRDADERWQVAFEAPLADDPERWSFWTWRLKNGHQAALAIDLGGSFVSSMNRVSA
jgi:4'-phosphopantetheinyl transferase